MWERLVCVEGSGVPRGEMERAGTGSSPRLGVVPRPGCGSAVGVIVRRFPLIGAETRALIINLCSAAYRQK